MVCPPLKITGHCYHSTGNFSSCVMIWYGLLTSGSCKILTDLCPSVVSSNHLSLCLIVVAFPCHFCLCDGVVIALIYWGLVRCVGDHWVVICTFCLLFSNSSGIFLYGTWLYPHIRAIYRKPFILSVLVICSAVYQVAVTLVG